MIDTGTIIGIWVAAVIIWLSGFGRMDMAGAIGHMIITLVCFAIASTLTVVWLLQ